MIHPRAKVSEEVNGKL